MVSIKTNAKPTRGRNALADGDLRDRFIPYGVPVGFRCLGLMNRVPFRGNGRASQGKRAQGTFAHSLVPSPCVVAINKFLPITPYRART